MEILISGERLRLRRADLADLNFIFELQYKAENVNFVLPFSEARHREIITSNGNREIDVIVEEISSGAAVGYFMVCGLDTISAEFRHVIIDKKGVGYGRESLQLLMRWAFDVKKLHRAWLDCKPYNARALHLYESLGFQRDGIERECIFVNGVYEDLIILSILDREFRAKK